MNELEETDKALKDFFENVRDIFGANQLITLVVTTQGQPIDGGNIKVVSNDTGQRVRKALDVWSQDDKH